MSTHKHFDRICCVVLAVTMLLTILFANAEVFGVQKIPVVWEYENKLFDTSTVHTIDILMDDWDGFLAECKNEEYVACTVVIDNEAYKNVAIRAKGNTSLTQVESYGNDRYSFKIEFDHYDSTKSYYGLDKLCLNNIIQDNTYMKDYLTYQMMAQMGVAAPLCSYVSITVNGEDWGLYLAVEGIEEAFLQRNYGKEYGELYKPDSSGMGGGRGNGEKFDMNGFFGNSDDSNFSKENNDGQTGFDFPQMPDGAAAEFTGFGKGDMPGKNGFDKNSMFGNGNDIPEGDGQIPDGDRIGDEGRGTNGSDDVLLKYIDDDADSYANIFNNAKTDVSDSDQQRLIEALKKLSSGGDAADAVDIERVIRYFVVHNFVLNFDSYTGSMIHNYYLYEKDGQMQMIPWDYNLAFGGFQSAGGAEKLVNYPIDSPVSGGNAEERPMIAWIFDDEEYTELYHQYFAEFISEWFDNNSFEQLIDDTSAMISPYVEKDPTKFCTYEEFEKGVATLKEFCLLRAESISGQLDGTIGSTSDTQSDETLVDSGDIQISDMGSMNNAMGGGADKQHGGNMQMPQLPQLTQGDDGDAKMPEASGGEDIADRDDAAGGNQAQTLPELPDMANGNQPFGGDVPDFPNGGFGPGGTDGGDPSSGGAAQKPPNGAMQMEPGSDNNMREPMQRPDEDGMRGEMGEIGKTEQPTSNYAASSWIWLGISVGVLAAGLAIAIVFKRRRSY